MVASSRRSVGIHVSLLRLQQPHLCPAVAGAAAPWTAWRRSCHCRVSDGSGNGMYQSSQYCVVGRDYRGNKVAAFLGHFFLLEAWEEFPAEACVMSALPTPAEIPCLVYSPHPSQSNSPTLGLAGSFFCKYNL